MAVPIEPETGLFPDTLVEPFVESDELAALSDEVLASFDEFEPIRTAIREHGLVIRYVWETKPFDPSKDELKPHTIAKVTKASPLWRCVAGCHLVIQFRQWFWDTLRQAQRRAVLHHELSHIEVDEDGKVSLREHDIEDFSQTMRRFGPIIPGRAGFVKAYLDWRDEQEPPEPTPLRSVGEDDVDAAAATDNLTDEASDDGLLDSTDEASVGLRPKAGDGIVLISGTLAKITAVDGDIVYAKPSAHGMSVVVYLDAVRWDTDEGVWREVEPAASTTF